MEQKLIFIGYHDFDSKDKSKHYYVLDFISEPKVSEDKKRATAVNVTIFTNEENYNKYKNNFKLLSLVPVKYELNGDKVRYYL